MNYMVSLVETLNRGSAEGIQFGIFTLGNESLITRARNRMATDFLNSEHKWDKLLFIDADISWKYEHILALLKSEQSLIGGVYPVKKLPISLNFQPLPQHLHYFKTAERTPAEYAEYVKQENNDSNEIAVKFLTTGFMLISRPVLEELSKHAPKYKYPDLATGQLLTQWDFFRAGAYGDAYLSEDHFFCQMAAKYGFQPYLNPSVVVRHEGSYIYAL